ncbi:MAG: hypothetical protein LBG45_08905 [Dysgonamonadaceae bacterium]|nr:hypothetical protein [Dysgonamonadaceae bacterium]
MLNNLEEASLLLADDLYNTYFHFCTVLKRNSYITVFRTDRKPPSAPTGSLLPHRPETSCHEAPGATI